MTSPLAPVHHAAEHVRRLGARFVVLKDVTRHLCDECGNRATLTISRRGWRHGYSACDRHAEDVFSNARGGSEVGMRGAA